MIITELLGRPWTAIGRCVYANGKDGPPVLLAVLDDDGTDNGPATVNAIAAHLADLHNANLTRRTINASGAAMAAAMRS